MNAPTKAVDFSFADAGPLGNQILAKLGAMREVDPIYFSETQQSWVVTGHDEVLEGFRGDLPLSAVRLPHLVVGCMPEAEREARLPMLMHSTPGWIINTDPPQQLRLRRLMMKAFSRKVAEDMRPFARQVIRETLDAVGQGGEVEFVNQVARVIPARVILRLLGLSEDVLPRLHHWSIVLNAGLGGFAQTPESLDETEAVMQEMRAYFAPEIAKRHDNPSDDFLSALVTARDEGDDKLSEEEMVGICIITLIAGHDTTANTMALGVAALAGHPEVADRVRAASGEELETAVLEIMRYIGMSTMMPRIVAEDFTWRGHQLKKGQFVFLMIAGANRDPKVFPDPDRLDPGRDQFANMTFAPGLHHCIGHLLAKMQLGEFFPEFLRRFDAEVLDERLNFGLSLSFRGLESLRLRLIPRA